MQTPNTIQRKIIQKPLAWHIYVWANVCLFAFVYIFKRTHTHGSPHCAYNLAQVPWPVRLLEKGWPKTKEKKIQCCFLLSFARCTKRRRRKIQQNTHMHTQHAMKTYGRRRRLTLLWSDLVIHMRIAHVETVLIFVSSSSSSSSSSASPL